MRPAVARKRPLGGGRGGAGRSLPAAGARAQPLGGWRPAGGGACGCPAGRQAAASTFWPGFHFFLCSDLR
jgi:hypothetical protein